MIPSFSKLSINGNTILSKAGETNKISNSKEFLSKYGYGNLIYLTDTKSKFAINSGVFGVPETHIIKNGVIIRKYLGPLSFGDVEEIIFLYS